MDNELDLRLMDIEDRLDKIENLLKSGIYERILPILESVAKDIREIKTYR